MERPATVDVAIVVRTSIGGFDERLERRVMSGSGAASGMEREGSGRRKWAGQSVQRGASCLRQTSR